jgi:predicted nuclease of predicted toxin-antitoxin system
MREQGLPRRPNGGIFAKALAEDRIILTFDLDFAEIAALLRAARLSVIVFRLHNTRTPHVIQRLAAVLDESAAALDRGVVAAVEESRRRVRLLPAGEAG